MNVLPGLPKKQRVSLHSWCVKIIFAEKMNPLPRGNLVLTFTLCLFQYGMIEDMPFAISTLIDLAPCILLFCMASWGCLPVASPCVPDTRPELPACALTFRWLDPSSACLAALVSPL